MAAAVACCCLLLAVRSTPKNRFSPGAAKRRRVGRKLWALPRGCYGRPCRCTASEVLAKVVFTIFWGLGWSVLSETIEIELYRRLERPWGPFHVMRALSRAIVGGASGHSGPFWVVPGRSGLFWSFRDLSGHFGSFRSFSSFLTILAIHGHFGSFWVIPGRSGPFWSFWDLSGHFW